MSININLSLGAFLFCIGTCINYIYFTIIVLAFPADIGSKPASPARPARGNRQRLHADGGNMAAPVWSVSVRVTWAWQHGRSGYYIYNCFMHITYINQIIFIFIDIIYLYYFIY